MSDAAEPALAHQELVRQLLSPSAYSAAPGEVRLLQTHVSSLFFAGDYVYKVKRPVNYGFLDYSTLARRKRFCRLEVALNRPMAPNVYLGVVEVRREDGRLYIAEEGGDKGEVVDYAVKMRRLSAESSLSAMLKADKVSPADARRIGHVVAAFHARARRTAAIARQGGMATVQRNILENFRQTQRYVGVTLSQDTYDDILAFSRAFLQAQASFMARRAQEGRIVDGHGDLKASDIYIVDGEVKILDCIEFNRRFRYGDAASDIAFLAMDLDYHQHAGLSQAFVDAYVEASGDQEVTHLLGFFKCYRAYVRGKVNSFLLDDPTLSPARRQEALDTAGAYFRLAHTYTRVFPCPAIIMVCGLMGTGKTTVAAELARRWQGTHISSDVTRKALTGLASTEHRYESYGQGLYAPGMSQRTYDAMLAQAKEAVAGGRLAILDATYRAAQERRQVVQAAQAQGIPLWIVECTAPEDVVRRRVLLRTAAGASASDARWELYPQQKAEWQPIPIHREAHGQRYIVLDTRGAPSRVMQRLLRELFLRVLR